MIKKKFGNVNYEIAKLDGDFGPAVIQAMSKR